MFFIEKCTEEDLKQIKHNYNLQMTWDTFNTEKISINGKVVALIAIDKEHYGFTNHKMIDQFEVIEKSKGIGTKIIKYLIKDKGEKLCLYPDNERATGFWIKLGFKGEYEGAGVTMYYYPPLQSTSQN